MTEGGRAGWWANDPTRRHELRYWDGNGWTEHVADFATVAVDPMTEADGTPEPELLSSTVPADPAGAPEPSTATEPVRPAAPPPPVPGTGIDPRGAHAAPGAHSWWRPLERLRTTLVVLLGCSAAAWVAVVVALFNRLDVIDEIAAGRFGFDLLQRANQADDAVDASAGVALVLAVATAVLFIVWQWRCAKNAEILGHDRPRFGAGWSVGGWFIPFANFVIPVLIIQDLWRASSPDARPGTWRREPGSGLVAIWWVAFVLGAVGTRLIDAGEAETLSELQDQNQYLLVASVLALVAALLAIAVVVTLTKRFAARR